MKKTCIILVFNRAFINKAIDTINQVRGTGGYNGDIVCVVGDDLADAEAGISSLSYNIVYKYFPDIDRSEVLEVLKKNNFDDGRSIRKNFQFHKFYCFHTFFKDNYDKCLYLDCGMQIIKPLDKILNLDCDNVLLAHSDSYPKHEWTIGDQFDKSVYLALHLELSRAYNLNCDYFQSTMMLYDTSIILDETIGQLIYLSKKYFNSRNNDQGILDIYFICIRNLWRQIQIRDNETFYYDFFERNGFSRNDYIMLKYPKTM